MRSNRSGITKPEVALRSMLHRLGYRFRKDFSTKERSIRVRPDVAFPRSKVAVFVDGCFWHRCPVHGTVPKANAAYWVPKLEQNVQRDQTSTKALRDAGWIVLRIWEHEPVDLAAKRVVQALRQRTGKAK
ncbi:MAG: very short patch repair endonuclease, partial [Chloroflexi bacterium]|nr:very short patch repair endonuclease [Chloroflexota bacterium]